MLSEAAFLATSGTHVMGSTDQWWKKHSDPLLKYKY